MVDRSREFSPQTYARVAGVLYLINSFALILAPTVADFLFLAILLPSFFAELSLCLWLLVKGIDVSKWPATTQT